MVQPEFYNIEVDQKPGFGISRHSSQHRLLDAERNMGACQLVPLPTYGPNIYELR